VANLAIGLDLGDRYSAVYVLDAEGECVEMGRVRTTPAALRQRFAGMPGGGW
jgi:hypothetical protein